MSKKDTIFVVFLDFGILFLFFIYCFREATKEYDQACVKITTIAKDVHKVRYIENWIGTKLNDPNFIKLIGKKRRIDIRDYPELMSSIDIDWDYLGLSKNTAFISINRLHKDRDNYLDVNKIKSLSIGEGRRGIIIKLKGSDELGLEWPSEAVNRINYVGDDVMVYCN